ncbi:TIM barrel protein [Clostridium sp. UBA6640]|uniref:TIM barrel protein n=1 Tax=Clostridium sp. UBA6640 TaxID=1946370 RepID=UPI0025C16AE7|nr:TIM barrel protein [Clostridium sp. UBA6640]
MLKLMNFSTYQYDIERFNYDYKKLEEFLEKNNMDGIELLKPLMWQEETISKDVIKGIHLAYYPSWIDFWHGNQKELLRQFGDIDSIKKYYGDIEKDIIVENYRKEIEIADRLGAEYVVFHVSHVQLEHSYNYKFNYSDAEIIEATVELINEIFKGLNTNIKLLFENLWWPGLTMLDKNTALTLLEKVNYSNKGFMLDTGHLMNTNHYIEDEEQGVKYLIEVVNNLGDLKKFIKGIHLNYSLSGKYIIEQIEKNNKNKLTLKEMNENIYKHVMNIDRHKPFSNKVIKSLVELINPEYVIYEFITSSLNELEEYIKIQHNALS